MTVPWTCVCPDRCAMHGPNDSERVELLVAPETAAFLASLYGPDWRDLIPAPHRQETNP